MNQEDIDFIDEATSYDLWPKEKWLTCEYCKVKHMSVGYLEVDGKDVPCCPMCCFPSWRQKHSLSGEK